MLPLLFPSPLLPPPAASMNMSPPPTHPHAHKSCLNCPELSQTLESALPDPTAVSTSLSSPAPQGFLQPLQMQTVPMSTGRLHILLPLPAMPMAPLLIVNAASFWPQHHFLRKIFLISQSRAESFVTCSLGTRLLSSVVLLTDYNCALKSVAFYLGLCPSPPAAKRGHHGEEGPCLPCSSMSSQCLALSECVWRDSA